MNKFSQSKSKIRKFNEIVSNIKSVKIQGAREIARKALIAYSLFPNEKTARALISLRPTEPMLLNLLEKAKKQEVANILNEIGESQKAINENLSKIMENGDIILTHCHSNTVIEALVHAKNIGRNFKVYATETRPLYQGRKTASDLAKNKISVEMFVDSSAMMILSGKEGIKPPKKFFIGADAITEDEVINKIGSGMFAKLASENKIPLYVISNSLKFTDKNVKMEKRNSEEIWKNAPKGVAINNFAFEKVEKKYVTKIISELGILSYEEFLKRVR